MYDYVFITHLPSFYKVNLYNSISKNANIFVIFISSGSKERTNDFVKKENFFNYTIISNCSFESRSRLYSLYIIYKLIKKLKYKKIVLSGWELIEFWLIALFSKKNKNCLCLESTILETNMKLPYFILKKLFISRIRVIFASGTLQSLIPKKLGYKEKIFITKGVGIIEKPNYEKISKKFECKFLFVGRLVIEKNLPMLIEAFSALPHLHLTIVGDGPLKSLLKKNVPNNIKFVEHIPNNLIHKIYLEHDVFILPSVKEAWGIVIDEALFYGLPIIASSKVGCHPEMVVDINSGFTFDPCKKENLIKNLILICNKNIFDTLKNNVNNFSLEMKDKHQTQIYLDAIDI